MKAWGDAKNQDDLLQNFFYNAASADVDVDLNVATKAAPSVKEMSADTQRAVESFRTLGKLLFTNDAFRRLGSDAILLTRDIFADAASNAADEAKRAADKARPSEKERKQGVDFGKLKNKGKATAKGLASGKLQGEGREAVWDSLVDAKDYFDEKLPEGEEAKDKLVERLKEIVIQAQSNKSYHQAINTLVGLVKKYASKAQDAAEETVDKSDVSDDDAHVQQAGRDLKAFVEKISNKSLDPLFNATKKAAEDVKNDDKLSAYFSELDNFLHRVLHQEGYIVSQRAYRKASSLYDDGQALLESNSQWKADAAELQKQLDSLVTGISNDKETNNLIEAIEELGNSLATAGQIGFGSLKVDGQGLYRDFVDVFVPRLIGLVKEIPVPRVEFKSEDVDLVIDDIKRESFIRIKLTGSRVCFLHSRLYPLCGPQRPALHPGLRNLRVRVRR